MAESTRARKSDAERFWSRVDKRGPEECWEWTKGRTHDGYGAFSYRDSTGRTINLTASRWLLGYLRGKPLGSGEEACHTCDNPPCVNPDHLYVGTHAENMADRDERGRGWQAKVTHCPQNHEYTEANTLVRKNGRRRCRQCARDAARRRQSAQTHCVNNHELAGENLLIVKNGKRKCRTCEDARIAAVSARMTEIWAWRRGA